MKYAVLGAGGIGRALIADVLATDQSSRILAIDNFDESLAAATKLEPGHSREGGNPGPRLATQRLDVADVAAVTRAIADADVVVNTTDGSRGIEILKACIQAKRPYVDVHGTLLVNERLALSDDAKAAGITAVIGMGCSPGITNMLGAYGARHAEGEITIEVEYITQRPMNPSMGLLDTVLRQFRDHIRSYEYVDGEFKLHPPFSGPLRTSFPGVGEVELVLTPHSEPQTLPLFVKGLKRVTVRGAYQPEIMDFVKTLSRFGLMNVENAVPVEGAPQPFLPLLRTAIMGDGSLKPPRAETVYCLRVRVIGERPGRRTVSEMTVGHPRGWDPLPQARMTAIPTAYTAQIVARGEFRQPGVCGPELFSDAQVEDCLAYLRARGLWTLSETRTTAVSENFDAAVPA